MRFFKFLLLTPVAAILLAFAFANREMVTIYFDPIGGYGVAPLPAPEYAVVFVAMALGVVAGGIAAWLGQGRHRRAAREAEAEVARLRHELQSARFSATPALARHA